MKLGNSVAAVIVACGLAVTGVAGTGAAQPATPASASVDHEVKAADQLSLPQLLDAAADEVHMTFPNAELMVADGSSPSGRTQDMSQVTEWRLVSPATVLPASSRSNPTARLRARSASRSPTRRRGAASCRSPTRPALRPTRHTASSRTPGTGTVRLAGRAPRGTAAPAVPLLQHPWRLRRVRGERRRPRRQPHLRLTAHLTQRRDGATMPFHRCSPGIESVRSRTSGSANVPSGGRRQEKVMQGDEQHSAALPEGGTVGVGGGSGVAGEVVTQGGGRAEAGAVGDVRNGQVGGLQQFLGTVDAGA
ncbi:membrane protein [Streptomyces noursei ATCC 11455]|nr:membrane protein [Streptomyces noursei ATCC 11455]